MLNLKEKFIIEPIVFPFTYLDADTSGMLLSCFHRIRLYVPTDSARDEFYPELLHHERIAVRNPLSDDGLKVEQAFRDYRQWRQANRGTDISFFKAPNSKPPFFDETTISFLRHDILSALPGASEKTTDLLTAARVFLRMTSSYDRARAEVKAALISQTGKELSMLAALQGDDEADGESMARASGSLSEDPGELMTAERLKAWAMLAAGEEPPGPVFATPSRAVLAAVTDLLGSRARIWEHIPVPGDGRRRGQDVDEQWLGGLDGFLSGLQQKGNGDLGTPPAVAADRVSALLTIVYLAEISPRFFLEILRGKPPESAKTRQTGEPESTIIAAVLPA